MISDSKQNHDRNQIGKMGHGLHGVKQRLKRGFYRFVHIPPNPKAQAEEKTNRRAYQYKR